MDPLPILRAQDQGEDMTQKQIKNVIRTLRYRARVEERWGEIHRKGMDDRAAVRCSGSASGLLEAAELIEKRILGK